MSTPGRTLTSGARTAMHPRERLLQRLVVGWQIAVAVVLLSGAALFVRSVQNLDRTPLGFERVRSRWHSGCIRRRRRTKDTIGSTTTIRARAERAAGM